MRKILPFIMVIAFWGLFYLGTTYPGAGETIATIAVILFIMTMLYRLKSYLLRRISNKQ